jgi:hypothetical protein
MRRRKRHWELKMLRSCIDDTTHRPLRRGDSP